MGGAGTASSKPFTAIFVNPALTTRHSDDFDFGLVLPFADAFVLDEDEFIDAADEFQDTLSEVQDFIDMGDLMSADALRPELAAQLQALSGSSVDVGANAGVGIVLPFEGFKLGIGFRGYLDAQALTLVDPADVAVILDNTSTSADLDNLQSEVIVAAAGVAEFGLSFAKELEFRGTGIALGVTPKFQHVETYNYAVRVSDFEDDDALDDFDDEVFRNDDSGFNLDLGASVYLTEHLTGGLAIRNLISNDYETVSTNGRSFTYQIEPQVIAGVALEGAGFTVTADLDLLTNERFRGAGDSQFVRVGAEYDLFKSVQVRAGYSYDFEETRQELLHAGIGLSPFEVVRIELVGLLGESAAGAGLQISFTI